MPKQLSAIGDDGKSVDWWFIYKVPKDATAPSATAASAQKASGYEYVYFDADSKALAGSEHRLDDQGNALHLTLQQFSGPQHTSSGCVFYNDEYPPSLHKTNDGDRAHAKGVLAFDTAGDSALWLLHSTPRFPDPEGGAFPAEELDYGQTFLCITLKDVKTAEAIAGQMLTEQGPQTYGANLPASVPASSVWRDLADSKFSLSKQPSVVKFESRAGLGFQSIAKSRLWGEDLWTDLVGPTLGANLDVESWRRGAIPGREDSTKHDDVLDVTAIDLTPLGVPYGWPETKDHAKWAASLKGEGDWVCVADINRQVSQYKRGGGTICFKHTRLWTELAKIDQITPAKLKR